MTEVFVEQPLASPGSAKKSKEKRVPKVLGKKIINIRESNSIKRKKSSNKKNLIVLILGKLFEAFQ